MARLLAGLLDTSTEVAQLPAYGMLCRLRSRFSPRARRIADGTGQIYIADNIGSLTAALAAPRFRSPAAFRILWLFDSFWTERLVSRAELKHFDHVVYMQAYDREAYESLLGTRAIHLPWGTDALRLGTASGERKIDLLRLGRQPEAWDDDAETARAAAPRGIAFAPRPGIPMSYRDLVGKRLANTKYVLCHSNLCDSAPYTHPTKEYITARWTDALAAGAIVAGRPPENDIAQIDWPGALLRVPSGNREEGLTILARAVANWTPDTARYNHRMALERLDWRWRFATLADRVGLRSAALETEIAQLQQKLANFPMTY